MSESKVTLKLYIDKKKNKVLYAEADKDFVDFLLHVFLLPVGAAMRHLVHDETPSANTFPLANLYNSLRSDDFTSKYLIEGVSVSSFLNPGVTSSAAWREVPFWSDNDLPELTKKYTNSCSRKQLMRFFSDTDGDSESTNYVKGVVTYMITDDLAVKPLSSKSTIELLASLSVKDGFDCIQESVVTLDTHQGMALLKASLTSNTVLTDIFLRGKAQ